MQTWHAVNKSDWLPGPWSDEPDKAQWITAAGYDALIVRNSSGVLCGYVGVPPSHPCYEKSAFDLDLMAHCGLNYSDHCANWGDDELGICHIAEQAANADVWWLGFDCAHAFDLVPIAQKLFIELGFNSLFDTCMYRDFSYVQDVCESLAAQLAAIDSATPAT
jgi:hypothetical protein